MFVAYDKTGKKHEYNHMIDYKEALKFGYTAEPVKAEKPKAEKPKAEKPKTGSSSIKK